MKILIIGQAPPAVKQTLPYDTTMLYDWFKAIGISKETAQEIFEFEALIGEFPGYTDSGHRVPTEEESYEYLKTVMTDKLKASNKIIFLGNASRDFYKKHMDEVLKINPNIETLSVIHPSKRNMYLYSTKKKEILESLRNFINYE